MANPFKHTFVIRSFDEELFITQYGGLNHLQVIELGFAEFNEGSRGLTVFRKSNELGGNDYLPFVERFYPGNLPIINPEKDRWLVGYDAGFVLFILDEVQNRQHVRIDSHGNVTKGSPQ